MKSDFVKLIVLQNTIITNDIVMHCIMYDNIVFVL